MSAMAFGDQLRHARKAAGLTQEALAERAGVAPETISALERGVNRAPHRDTVEALGDALGLAEGEQSALLAAARRGTHLAAEGAPTREPSPQVGPLRPVTPALRRLPHPPSARSSARSGGGW
jgi:transcriptional regulator with XRE-family HTH domain